MAVCGTRLGNRTSERRTKDAACTYVTNDRNDGCLPRIHDNASDGAHDLRVGDVVRLREAHGGRDVGTLGRIIGFYVKDPREALLVVEDGEQLSVPDGKLEQVPSN